MSVVLKEIDRPGAAVFFLAEFRQSECEFKGRIGGEAIIDPLLVSGHSMATFFPVRLHNVDSAPIYTYARINVTS